MLTFCIDHYANRDVSSNERIRLNLQLDACRSTLSGIDTSGVVDVTSDVLSVFRFLSILAFICRNLDWLIVVAESSVGVDGEWSSQRLSRRVERLARDTASI